MRHAGREMLIIDKENSACNERSEEHVAKILRRHEEVLGELQR
jgi:hypothetical protein